MRIIRDTKKCYGCGICSLICSFHHAKVFSPEISSIKVLTDMRTGKVEWAIDSTCDGCQSEPEPLCIKYCFYQAIEEA